MHSRLSIDDLPLMPSELEISNAVAPGMTPAELVDACGKEDPIERSMVWRVLYLLTEFELFRLGGVVEEPPLPG